MQMPSSRVTLRVPGMILSGKVALSTTSVNSRERLGNTHPDRRARPVGRENSNPPALPLYGGALEKQRGYALLACSDWPNPVSGCQAANSRRESG
jgi:hypothetical protein